jgi:hypothetical protein
LSGASPINEDCPATPLLFLIVSLGARMASPRGGYMASGADKTYFDLAWMCLDRGSTAIEREDDTGRLWVCALILLAVSMRLVSYYSMSLLHLLMSSLRQRDRHQLAWDIIGSAMRCALSIGLNHNDVQNDKRIWTTRIWTTLFALDTTISFELGHQVGSRVGPSNLSHQSALHVRPRSNGTRLSNR